MKIVNPTLVEICVEAQRELIEEHGYSPEDFLPADGTETLFDGFGEPMDAEPLIGAPLYWYRRHGEHNVWSYMLACQLLDAIQPDLDSANQVQVEELSGDPPP
jgi:hypothetical protein